MFKMKKNKQIPANFEEQFDYGQFKLELVRAQRCDAMRPKVYWTGALQVFSFLAVLLECNTILSFEPLMICQLMVIFTSTSRSPAIYKIIRLFYFIQNQYSHLRLIIQCKHLAIL